MASDRKWVERLIAAALLLLPLQNFILAQSSREGDLAVMVNSDTPVTDLSLAEVRNVFLGQRQYWNPKLPVVLLMRAPVAR
jgi:ABC-type phosphate transport system substrate-binding protein